MGRRRKEERRKEKKDEQEKEVRKAAHALGHKRNVKNKVTHGKKKWIACGD